MKALVLEEYGRFVYRDVPRPAPGPHEVLVRVRACAVCGSDVHGMDGSTGRRVPPLIMGHEAAGDIAALGEGVSGWQVGERVTFDSTVSCGQCGPCLSGRVNLCENRRVLGVSCADYRMHGAFAEYVAVPARILYRLPREVSYVQAAMVEPLAIACHAVTRVSLRAEDTVLVVGVGTIGMLCLQVARSLGAGRLIAVDLDRDKLRMALEKGADDAVAADEPGAFESVLANTPGGRGAQVAIDATGINATLDFCLKALAPGGRAVLVGNLAPKTDFPLQAVVTRELSLFGSCACAGEYPASLELIAKGRVDVESLVSKTVPLSDGHEWITRVYNKERGLNKIVLIP